MEAIRNGVKGVFSDADWKTGQPQRYGWQEIGKEKKELPKEIINFIQRRRPEEKPATDKIENEIKPPAVEQVIETNPVKSLEKVAKTAGKKVVKPKKEKHDNPKQKERGTAKRNPGRVAKN